MKSLLGSSLQQVAKAPTDALQTLESTAASLVSLIIAEQTNTQGLGGSIALPLESKTKLQLVLPPRLVTLSELQRLKRQFVAVHRKAITQGAIEKGNVDWSEESIARKFVEYLEEHLRGS